MSTILGASMPMRTVIAFYFSMRNFDFVADLDGFVFFRDSTSIQSSLISASVSVPIG